MKKIGYTLLVGLFFLSSHAAYAKLLPRYSGGKKVVVAPVSTNQYVSAKLREDRKALLVTFSSLQSVKTLDYTLTYSSNGVDQGVTGSVDVSESNSVSRTLVFGTESKGVYTYHTNIKNMHFVVTIVLKNGKTVVKKYLVKP